MNVINSDHLWREANVRTYTQRFPGLTRVAFWTASALFALPALVNAPLPPVPTDTRAFAALGSEKVQPSAIRIAPLDLRRLTSADFGD